MLLARGTSGHLPRVQGQTAPWPLSCLCRIALVALCLLSAACATSSCSLELGLSSAQGQSELCRVLPGCQSVPSLGSQHWDVTVGDRSLLCPAKGNSGVGALAPADAFSCSSSFCKQITQKIRGSTLGRLWQEALLCRLEMPAVSMALLWLPPKQGVWSSCCWLLSSSLGLCDVS